MRRFLETLPTRALGALGLGLVAGAPRFLLGAAGTLYDTGLRHGSFPDLTRWPFLGALGVFAALRATLSTSFVAVRRGRDPSRRIPRGIVNNAGLLAVLSMLAAGCGQEPDVPNEPTVAPVPSSEQVAPPNVAAAWQRLSAWYDAGQRDSIVGLLADSAVILSPEGAVAGDRASILAAWTARVAESQLLQRRSESVDAYGTVALERGRLISDAGEEFGYYVTQWRRDTGEVWHILLDAVFYVENTPRAGPAQSPVSALDVVGLFRNNGTAWQYFAWAPSGWYQTWLAMPGGSEVTLVDTSGTRSIVELDAPRHAVNYDGVAYSVVGSDRFIAAERGWHRIPIGYFVADSTRHAPFLEDEVAEAPTYWTRIANDATPVISDTVAISVSAQVWSASLDSVTVRYFAITRSGASGRCSVPYEEITGWFPNPTSDEAVVLGVSSGDCEGKGTEQRRPYALLRRGGEYFILMGTLGWEYDHAEIWEVGRTQLLRLDPGPAQPVGFQRIYG